MSRPDRPSAIAQNAADRDAIRAADPVRFLIDAMQGKPAAVRDEAGRIVAWSEPPDLGQRISIAQALSNKVLPNLQAQSIDLNTSGDGMLRIVLGEGLAPPVSKTIEHQESVAATEQPKALEPSPHPATGEPEPPISTRKRRNRTDG